MKLLSIFIGALFCFTLSAVVAVPTVINQKQINVYSNHKAFEPNSQISTLMVVIHGCLRQPKKLATAIDTYLSTYVNQDEVIYMAPRFRNEDDMKKLPAETQRAKKTLFWTNGGWKRGDKSKEGSSTSSYAVVDELINRATELYPNLKNIIVIGHSAGGQFVQRYALTSTNPNLHLTISFKFYVMNPSTYAYLDSERPVPGTLNEFAVPYDLDGLLSAKFASLEQKFKEPAELCNTYDNYKFGLMKKNGYFSSLNNDVLREQYRNRYVYYVLGEADNDPDGEFVENEDPAILQGPHRYARGQSYFKHVHKQFGEGNHNHQIISVPNIGHDGPLMIQAIIESLLPSVTRQGT